MTKSLFFYVILEEGAALSKKEYSSWREIQDEYRDYVSSLGPWSVEELKDYFRNDFKEKQEWPFSEKEIVDLVNSDKTCLVKREQG